MPSGGTRALTSSSIHTDVNPSLLGTRGRVRGKEVHLEDAEVTSDPLAPARGVLLTAIAGTLVWITLIAIGYFLVEAARW
jgi:hypothetical protein